MTVRSIVLRCRGWASYFVCVIIHGFFAAEGRTALRAIGCGFVSADGRVASLVRSIVGLLPTNHTYLLTTSHTHLLLTTPTSHTHRFHPLSKIVIHTSAHPYCTEVWMTILESGWNLWVWLVGVVSRRWVWLVVRR